MVRSRFCCPTPDSRRGKYRRRMSDWSDVKA